MLAWLTIGAIIVLALWLIVTFNSLVALKNKTHEAWSDIDVHLKRRSDLIPNLVETVKGYATHEQGTFQKVVEARNRAMGAQSVAEHAQAETLLTQALKSIFALAEAYPELKANQNFLQLQTQLAEIEETIQAARRFYNGNVRDLNIALQVFPTNIVGKALGFHARDFFEIAEAEKAAPAVKL